MLHAGVIPNIRISQNKFLYCRKKIMVIVNVTFSLVILNIWTFNAKNIKLFYEHFKCIRILSIISIDK